MNNNTTPEQNIAKEKALAVIESCTRCEHFKYAEPFLGLFLKQFNDHSSYDELYTIFKNKKIELNCND